MPLFPESDRVQKRFVRATDTVSMICSVNGKLTPRNAIWWLLLEPDYQSARPFKPSRFTSFNTRYDKLNVRGSAGFQAYRQQRCVIPVSGFGETMKGPNSQLHYHDFTCQDDSPFAMGGLYRQWAYKDHQGQRLLMYSCSVVTLPPHPKLARFHPKSSPLMLSTQDGSLQTWLDDSIQDVAALDYLLSPRLRHNLMAIPIDKPSTHQVVGETIVIPADGD